MVTDCHSPTSHIGTWISPIAVAVLNSFLTKLIKNANISMIDTLSPIISEPLVKG